MDAEQKIFWGKRYSKRSNNVNENNKVETTVKENNNKNGIVDLINKCSKEATKKPEMSSFQIELDELVDKLREIFRSEYCAIGTVDENYVIDRACTMKLSSDVIWASIESESCLVCQSLGHKYNDVKREPITHYNKSDLEKVENYKKYQCKFTNGLNNATVVIIQDDEGDPQGYLQFLNSGDEISTIDYEVYKADMLRLAYVVKQWYALEDERLFLKDFNFINNLSGRKKTVDSLLSEIREYLSVEFNAGIISFRIPLLVGVDRQPVFFLRDYYINEKIISKGDVIKCHENRRVIPIGGMGGVEKLICENHGFPMILAEPNESGSDIGVSQDVAFKREVVVIPIICDHSGENTCDCDDESKDRQNSIKRFEKYYGIFKLRITKGEDEDDNIPKEIQTRLYNLAKHISALFNAIVDKGENESLNTFQTGLRNSTFTEINKFDEQCAYIIKNSSGAVGCAIYKYDKLSDEMVLSASTSEQFQIGTEGNESVLHLDVTLKNMIGNCRHWFQLEKDVINLVFEKNEPVYYVRNANETCNSLMLVPMKKNDGTPIGLMALVGKDMKEGDISKTYWEQDKKCIKFMVDILTRIVESDTDRLTFLLRLSHELRKPITEMVYRNDLLLSTVERNSDNIYIKELSEGLRYNMNSCMMFQEIIKDIETTYYMRKGGIYYSFTNTNVKECLLEIIRLFEQGGRVLEKRLSFQTLLSKMPQTMCVDKERIKQVFTNLLKNAIQYSNRYSEITISYSFNEGDKCHEIDFQNYGIGIASKEEAEKIFNLWYRSESAKKMRPNGTGMGLSIVKEIMEAHKPNGRCYVKHLNNPTIFTVSIPAK